MTNNIDANPAINSRTLNAKSTEKRVRPCRKLRESAALRGVRMIGTPKEQYVRYERHSLTQGRIYETLPSCQKPHPSRSPPPTRSANWDATSRSHDANAEFPPQIWQPGSSSVATPFGGWNVVIRRWPSAPWQPPLS